MDLFDALKGALRRWYVLLPILIITAALALVVYGRKTTEYSSSAVIGVTTSAADPVASPTPSATASIAPNNQLIANGGITLVTNLLTIGLQNDAVTQAVQQAGGTSDYTVEVVQRGTAGLQLPIVNLSARGASSAPVATTMRVLVSQANAVLANIQQSAGVAESRFVRTFVIDPVTAPARSTLSTARNVGAVVVVGVVVALIAAAVTDNVVSRRRARAPRLDIEPRHSATAAESPSLP